MKVQHPFHDAVSHDQSNNGDRLGLYAAFVVWPSSASPEIQVSQHHDL